MEALILSCGTGGGHNTAARAISECFIRHGDNAVVLNPYALKSDRRAHSIDRAYIGTVQHFPLAFGMAYKAGNIYRRLPIRSPLYHANKNMAFVLKSYLDKNHFDVIIATHFFAAEIITQMKNKGFELSKSIFVATDYTCTPFTEETNCDAYVVPTKEHIEEFANWGISREKIYPLGIPVSAEFSSNTTKSDARALLSLDDNKKYILICGGSMGAGDLTSFIKRLIKNTDNNTELIVVCGSNEALFDNVNRIGNHRIIPIQYTKQMALYMKACDIFLSKPGGLSSTEAAISGVPLVHLPPIPGCETSNAEFFSKADMSIKTTRINHKIKEICQLLDSENEREMMIKSQMKVIPNGSGERIYNLAYDLIHNNEEKNS